MRTYTEEEVIALLKERCAKPSSRAQEAAKLGVSASYITLVLAGRRRPGKALTDGMRLERVIVYRPKG